MLMLTVHQIHLFRHAHHTAFHVTSSTANVQWHNKHVNQMCEYYGRHVLDSNWAAHIPEFTSNMILQLCLEWYL